MGDIYLNKSTSPVSVIPLSTNDGRILIGVWKKSKNIWHIIKSRNEKNVIDILTPRQFHEALQNGNR
jgi:hypothetical protein